ncbi:uncharacterized protein EAE97_008329 [Botrytis byssoidea]|uniref:DUF7918 domain-containing protein n=1 Tax=Botrytis byssoidea TaxID=139641 RepID=A0A9P5I9H2_9HELO|nr:uncharacterized protein EAE97_008329 [Botrytis byssoidea]KAF7935422.1 hypothetical protein EAE97_008329 [Botrytis byssoidea]
MAILTEEGNEYEVKIIDCATNQPFKEYVKLGDLESHGDSKCERYIVARPGAKFKIEVTLMSGFCFEPFQQVQAHLCLGSSGDRRAAYIFRKDKPEINGISKGYKGFIECVNMARYGEDIVGAPFIFSSLDVDEDLSNETDVIGLDPADIGHFSVGLYRRTMEKEKIKTSTRNSTKPSTHLWHAKKVDQLNFKKYGVGSKQDPTVGLHLYDFASTRLTVLNFQYMYRTSEFLDHLYIVPYPPSLYYTPWKSLATTERQCSLKELQSLSKVQVQLAVNQNLVYAREPREWRTWNNMQPSERQSAFMMLQKDQKAFERGEFKQQMSCVPAKKIIVLDDDGTAPQPSHPRALAKIKREAQGPPNATKQEIKTSYGVLTQRPGPNMTQNCKIKKEHVDRDHVDLSAEEPLAKRRKIKQEPMDMNVVNNVKNQQEPMDLDTLDEMAIVLKTQATIKYDLTELEDAIILPESSTPRADLEESDYLEMAEEVLRQTADEFVRIRG